MTKLFKTTAEKVTLAALIAGHEVPQELNMRKHKPAEDIDSMAQMLLEKGQLVPLICFRHPDKRLPDARIVDDGNRRLLGLRKLAELGVWDSVVDVVTIEGDLRDPVVLTHAREIALMVNIGRLPPSEIEQYEAFDQIRRDMIEQNSTPEEIEARIASRFAMEPLRVRRVLALGALHPKIRTAWRDGNLWSEHETIKIVRAFTLVGDPDEQERVFDRLIKGKVSSWQWVDKISATVHAGRQTGQLLRFVGKDEYERGGGRAIVDLFEEMHGVSDVKLLNKMVADRMRGECEKLVTLGWSWAMTLDDAGNQAYSWNQARVEPAYTKEEKAEIKRLEKLVKTAQDTDPDDDPNGAIEDAGEDAQGKLEEIEAAATGRAYTPEIRKRSGCLLKIGGGGELKITFGVMKPGQAKADKALSTASPAEKARRTKDKIALGGISNALMFRVATTMTMAARDAILEEKSHVTTMAFLVAAMMHAHVGQCALRARPDGTGWQLIRGKEEKQGALLARLLDMSLPELIGLARRCVAMSIDFGIGYQKIKPLDLDGAQLVANSIDAKAMNFALLSRFDAKDFFGSAPTAIARAALEECGAPIPKGGKDVVVKAAIGAINAKGWLPEMLRTAHYPGPSAAPKKTTAKKVAKRTAKKK